MKTSSWLSKSIKITAVLALAAAAIGFANSAKAVTFGYSSLPGSAIHFDGMTHFDFTPAGITSKWTMELRLAAWAA